MAKSRKRRWIVLLLVIAVAVAAIVARRGGPDIKAGSYVVVDIDGTFAEGPPDGLFARVFEERKVLITLLGNLAKAARDERVTGVVARIGTLQSGWAQVREIRDALASVKGRGKRVIAFLDGNVPGANKEYYVASVADRIYLAPGGAPMLNGLSASFIFLGGLWEKAEVGMTVEQIREYKTFGDTVSRRRMSKAHREMANWILDGINSEFVETLAAARGMTPEQIQTIIDTAPSTPDSFVEAGLADGVLFLDQLDDELGGERPTELVKESTYSKVDGEALGLGGGPKIAVVYAVGTIVPGKGGGRSVFGVTVGSETLARAFDDAADDPDIRAIVFRVDSPGGSASASDQVWRSARVARERKPVVASLGDTAASGGYYMAVGADRILAEPSSLTGSIGVVLVKPDVSELLGSIGITTEALTRGRYARILDLTKDLDDQERTLLRAQMDTTYRLFVDRVAQARGMTAEEVDSVGGGRVWTGRQALERGLIDDLGGFQEALRAAATAAEIEDPDRVEIVFYPKPEGLLAELTSIAAAGPTPAWQQAWTRRLEGLAPYALLDAGIHAISAGTLQIR